jgi:hypothetical protein
LRTNSNQLRVALRVVWGTPMGKSRYTFTEEKIDRWVKEGRGNGRGVDYRPWLSIADVSSSGLSHRIDGRTTRRVHHCLSKIEMRMFLFLDWADHIVDVREQFPLNRKETKEIALELGVRHPTDPTTKVPIVMTTDFVVDTNYMVDQPAAAFAVKPVSQLGDMRTLEKLEIERIYWLQRGVKWKITTEHELATPLVDSLISLQGNLRPDGLALPPNLGLEKSEALIMLRLAGAYGVTVSKFCLDLDNETGAERGTMLGILRHLIAVKVVRFPEEVTFSPNIGVGQLTCRTRTARLEMVG